VEGEPNLLAYFVLAVSPLVAMAVVAILPAARACALIIVAGQMFLPPAINFDAPLIPPLDKDLLPCLGALVGCFLFRPKNMAGRSPGSRYQILLLVLVLGELGTILTNRDPLTYGPVILPGESLYDFLSEVVQEMLLWWVPFYLGLKLFRTSDELRRLFVILAVAGVVYSLFLFIELRMSPQLNRWVYGYHQSEFQQTMRSGGGYRPKVFMRHGLNVSLFMLITVMAAAALAKAKRRILGIDARWVTGYLLFVLVLCKSAGALVYATVMLPVLWFGRPKAQARFISLLALALMIYPLLRALGLLPVDDILAFFGSLFGGDRASSLADRFRNEGAVLERAKERILFGWGGYARPFVHDPVTGKNLTVIDGFAAATIGAQGIVGFVALFGFLLGPALRVRRRLARLVVRQDRILVATLGLIAVIYAADLIPNSSIDSYLTFLVGALAGTEGRLESTGDTGPMPEATAHPAPEPQSDWVRG
jgi:hypothetical protein